MSKTAVNTIKLNLASLADPVDSNRDPHEQAQGDRNGYPADDFILREARNGRGDKPTA